MVVPTLIGPAALYYSAYAELIDTLRRVHTGRRVMPSQIASDPATHMRENPITPKELLVLRGIAEGGSNRRIGAKLNMTEHIVKGHLKNILSNLGPSDRGHAIVIALKRGILDLSAIELPGCGMSPTAI